jgi:hypothetical protein
LKWLGYRITARQPGSPVRYWAVALAAMPL